MLNLKMIKKFALILLTPTLLFGQQAPVPAKPAPTVKVEVPTAAPAVDYRTQADEAAKAFLKDQDVDKLANSLKAFKQILKDDEEDYVVESFVKIYQDPKMKAKLIEALMKALDASDRDDFLKRLKNVSIEYTYGNG